MKSISTSGLALVLSVCALGLLAFAPRQTPAQKWEYKLVTENVSITAPEKERVAQRQHIEAVLNQLGADGWQLTVVVNGTGIFRRPAY